MNPSNVVVLTGNLGRDPDMHFKPDGTPSVARMSMAVTERLWSKEEGAVTKQTTWFNVVAFGATAGFAHNYLHTGDTIQVLGRINISKVDDKFYTDIHVESVNIVSSKAGKSDASDTADDVTAQVDEDEFPF